MSSRLDDLAAERERLRSEIADDRLEMARAAQRINRPLRRVASAKDGLIRFRNQYALLLLPVAVLVILKPRAAGRVAVGLWHVFVGAFRAGVVGYRLLETLEVPAPYTREPTPPS